MSPNHRVNDAICVVGKPLLITAKLSYGPVAMVNLTGEMVHVYIKRYPNIPEWKLVGSCETDSNGRLVFTTPTTGMEAGIYQVRVVVQGDKSSADCNVAIVPTQTEAVVFSVDSSFLESISISGINPKIRACAVDTVRHWQELGYFIIYVSSRLLYQKYQVTAWLSEHNFPLGIVTFCDTVSANFQKHKMTFLKHITEMEEVVVHVAYGSQRDIPVYLNALKLPAQRVFLLGKKIKDKKLESSQWITTGYASHLKGLKTNPLSKRSNNSSVMFSLGDFVLSSKRPSKKKKNLPVIHDEGDEDVFPYHSETPLESFTKSKVTKAASEDGSNQSSKRFTLKKTRSNNVP